MFRAEPSKLPSLASLGLTPLQGMSNSVDHPKHYNEGTIEVIDFMESCLTSEEFRGACKMNVIKYVSRERTKSGLEDLKKAAWYLNRLIEHTENPEKFKHKVE